MRHWSLYTEDGAKMDFPFLFMTSGCHPYVPKARQRGLKPQQPYGHLIGEKLLSRKGKEIHFCSVFHIYKR